MVDYLLKQGESIVTCATARAVSRLKKAVKYTTCLRLVPKKESVLAYFIVESGKVGQLERISGVASKPHLAPAMFAALKDETVYRRRRASQALETRGLFDN